MASKMHTERKIYKHRNGYEWGEKTKNEGEKHTEKLVIK